MTYSIKVGRNEREIICDDHGRIEYIDGCPICDIDEEEISACAIALARHQLNEGYVNSQDLSGLPDKAAYRAEQYVDERRGK